MTNEEILNKNLLVELGVEDADPEIQEDVINVFTETLFKKMIVRVFELLPAEKQAEFVAVQEGGDGEKVENFLKENIADFDKVMAEVAESAKEEFRGIVEQITR